MLRYYFSRYGMMLAGQTPDDKAYAQRKRERHSANVMDRLQDSLTETGFRLHHQPLDEDGTIHLTVRHPKVPRLTMLFAMHTECSELLDLTRREAAFHIESAATRETGIYYLGGSDDPVQKISNFIARQFQPYG